MREKIEQQLSKIDIEEQTVSVGLLVDARAATLVTLLFLTAMLSVPLTDTADLLLFSIYPVIGASLNRTSYWPLLRGSFVAIPFAAMIGLFNPIVDTQPIFYVGSTAISRGWITFLSIILRAMLSVQAVMLLIGRSGFRGFCNGLTGLGVPLIVVTQLFMVYRYLAVIANEALTMQRAREARSFGQKTMRINMWGTMIGQLLLRSFERAERVDRAMRARGYTGKIRFAFAAKKRWNTTDTLYLTAWALCFAALTLLRPAQIFTHL